MCIRILRMDRPTEVRARKCRIGRRTKVQRQRVSLNLKKSFGALRSSRQEPACPGPRSMPISRWEPFRPRGILGDVGSPGSHRRSEPGSSIALGSSPRGRCPGDCLRRGRRQALKSFLAARYPARQPVPWWVPDRSDYVPQSLSGIAGMRGTHCDRCPRRQVEAVRTGTSIGFVVESFSLYSYAVPALGSAGYHCR